MDRYLIETPHTASGCLRARRAGGTRFASPIIVAFCIVVAPVVIRCVAICGAIVPATARASG